MWSQYKNRIYLTLFIIGMFVFIAKLHSYLESHHMHFASAWNEQLATEDFVKFPFAS